MSIATNLRREMDANAVTETVLASKSGVDVSFIRKYLAGKSRPSEAILTRLARGIGITPDKLSKDPLTRTNGKIRPEDAGRRLGRSAQDIRIGIRQGLLPFGTAYKREGSSVYTYEIDPISLEAYAQEQDKFWEKIIRERKSP